MLLEHSRPDYPWIAPDAVRLLTSMLRPSDRGVEYGSGRSTLWFAERVGHLTSVEHDQQWFSAVSAKLVDRKLTNVNYILAPRDQPDARGDISNYTLTALSFTDLSIDFALIDGLYREHITKLIIPKVKHGGLLIIDNVNWFLPSESRAPASRTTALGPNGPIWAESAEILSDWRLIWTSSGISDTAIFLRP